MNCVTKIGVKQIFSVLIASALTGLSSFDCFAQFIDASDVCNPASGSFSRVVVVNGVYTITGNEDDTFFNVAAGGQIVVGAGANNVRLTKVKIDCQIKTDSGQNGLTAMNVNGLTLRNVCIRDCGGHGLFILGGSGHDIAESDIKGTGTGTVKKAALVLDGVTDSDVIGFTVGHGAGVGSGIELKNGSQGNRIASTLVFKPQQSNPSLVIDGLSIHNQVVRNRFQGPSSEIQCTNGDNLWLDNHCAANAILTPSGNCQCGPGYFPFGAENDRIKYPLRSWTVCTPNESYKPYSCTRDSVNLVLSDSNYLPGDLIVVDSQINDLPGFPKTWGAIDVPAGPLWLIGNNISQNGQFNFQIKFQAVTGSGLQVNGTRLQNIFHHNPTTPIPLPPNQGEHINVCYPNGCYSGVRP